MKDVFFTLICVKYLVFACFSEGLPRIFDNFSLSISPFTFCLFVSTYCFEVHFLTTCLRIVMGGCKSYSSSQKLVDGHSVCSRVYCGSSVKHQGVNDSHFVATIRLPGLYFFGRQSMVIPATMFLIFFSISKVCSNGLNIQ